MILPHSTGPNQAEYQKRREIQRLPVGPSTFEDWLALPRASPRPPPPSQEQQEKSLAPGLEGRRGAKRIYGRITSFG